MEDNSAQAVPLSKHHSSTASSHKTGKSRSPTMLDNPSANTISNTNILDTPMGSGQSASNKHKTFGQSNSQSMLDDLGSANNRPPSSQNSASKAQNSGRNQTGRKESGSRQKSSERNRSESSGYNVRKYPVSNRPQPKVHLNTSPSDLQALTENRLFQSYQTFFSDGGTPGSNDGSLNSPMLGMQNN